MKFRIAIKCTQAIPDAELHPVDKEDNPVSENVYTIAASSVAEAIALALDEFHSTVPIKVLDDFVIKATCVAGRKE